VAQVFSARDPEALRGPQFDAAWCDELAKWEKGDEAWKNLQFALRLGQDPRQLVTTTPQNVAVLKELLDSPSTVVTRAATDVNEANLARSFLTEIMTQYGGTSTGRQEIEGLLLTETDGALWSRARIEALRLGVPDAFSRIVVAVDPATTGKPGADECGIIVAGAVTKGPKRDWRAWVLEDCTVPAASPNAWADEAVRAFHRHRADRLVVEVNQGGDMVRSVIETVDGSVPIRTVTASRGKHVRAEPVAALYEQGRVHHVRGLDKLEDQMCAMTRAGYNGRGSPDRVDALVWALSELMIEPPGPQQDPRVRTI
jgi:phage terminase large subunit-like protein